MKKLIQCSRCAATFYNGNEYRIHYDIHLKDWEASKDKEKYIKNTTNIYKRNDLKTN